MVLYNVCIVCRSSVTLSTKLSIHTFLDSQLGVGFTTRTLNRLVEAGDVSMDSAKNFHLAARSFFVKAVEYATAKLPLHDPVLEHSRFVDFRQKMDTTLDDVLYFVHRYVCSHLGCRVILVHSDSVAKTLFSNHYICLDSTITCPTTNQGSRTS